jgi:hypothetical protein
MEPLYPIDDAERGTMNNEAAMHDVSLGATAPPMAHSSSSRSGSVVEMPYPVVSQTGQRSFPAPVVSATLSATAYIVCYSRGVSLIFRKLTMFSSAMTALLSDALSGQVYKPFYDNAANVVRHKAVSHCSRAVRNLAAHNSFLTC